MSHAKRRTADMAPGLFPFMAVLLCLIGALVLILAITVTQSHASARRDAEAEILQAKSEANTTVALSDDYLAKRDQLRQQVEARRIELQQVEDHLKRLQDEFKKTLVQLEDVSTVDQERSSDIEIAKKQIDALKQEIESKELEIQQTVDGGKNKKPAFSIIPYTGRNGTTRRPIYIECTNEGILVQPEGILITPRDLIPPGPGNPLSVALRLLRSDFEEQDRKLDRMAPPPYPLLLVRPDGVESYAYARQALADWDDQFGYELIDEDMALAFPPGAPGIKERLARAVDDAKRRQIALLQADPQLARKYELSEDVWPDEANSNHPRSSFTGVNSDAASSQDFQVDSRGDWKMVQSAPSSGNGTDSSNASAPTPRNLPGPATGATPGTAANSFSGGWNLPDASTLQPIGSGAAQNNHSHLGGAGNGSLAQLPPGQNGTDDGAAEGGAGGAAEGNSASGSGGSSDDPAALTNAGGGEAGGGGSSGTGAGSGSNAGSSTGGASQLSSNMESGTDPLDPNATQASQSISTSVQIGESSSKEQPKYVNADGDSRPIAFTAGKDWAQAKVEGKATPISRTIQIVALKETWYVRREGTLREFDAIIQLSDGPQKVSSELATAIRGQVDSWGLSIRGGYWVPLVSIEAASDAEISVERMRHLLEGSGVTIHVVPLKLQ